MIDADELVRLKAVDAAAREWAESRLAPVGMMWGDAGWSEIEQRHDAARTALLALFAPSSPVVSPATTEVGAE